MTRFDWKPRSYGKGLYCSPACGAGCSRVAFDKATAEANKLAKAIGVNWRVHVWENLGWHYEIYKGVCHIHPSKVYRSNSKNMFGSWKVTGYTVYFNSVRQMVGEGSTALEALHEALDKVDKSITALQCDRKEVLKGGLK